MEKNFDAPEALQCCREIDNVVDSLLLLWGVSDVVCDVGIQVVTVQ